MENQAARALAFLSSFLRLGSWPAADVTLGRMLPDVPVCSLYLYRIWWETKMINWFMQSIFDTVKSSLKL
ncbi:hypothetical protein IGI04_037806 [Brassica rapa subsp. trilocularis]|uniref:Uncharacterized protein n=1 Tax=Brassica rapa subsp. trilocularis TaxID=1813537 RepID=A0ABQ7LKR3_BRACM|nr:hypothetical protein IGI04_037806 [Brassica rapa subsp. trilocularis]